MQILKKCVTCKELKLEEEFHRRKSSPDGRRSDCKECRKIETQKRMHKYRDKLNREKREWYLKSKNIREQRNEEALKIESKHCPNCLESKSPESFYFRSNGGLQNICKECWNVRSKLYEKENIDNTRRLKRSREQRRRARMRHLPHDFSEMEWKDCIAFFGNKCAYCGVYEKELTQDHVIAVSKGGPYTKTNIVPACFSCNTRKHNTDMESWFSNQDYFSEERLRKINRYINPILIPSQDR